MVRRSLSLLVLISCCLVSSWIAAVDGLSGKSFDELLRQANTGDVSAQFAVASAYDTGNGVARNGVEAMRWYRRAAEAGYAEAQNSVGSGLQAEKKYADALIWYERAANQRHALATNNLAYLYDIGLGVKQDRERAASLYLASANLGWAEAMWNLANMYGAGQLGPRDLETACVWTMRARRFAGASDKQMLAMAEEVLPKLERALSAAQFSACRAKGENWSPGT